MYEAGYESTWRLCSVDPYSWADTTELGHILSASITRSINGTAPSIDSANVELSSEPPAIGSYVRLWMDARSKGILKRVPIVTARVAPSSSDISDNLRVRSDVALDSVLKPAEETAMANGWYAPQGSDAIQIASALLSSCIFAPVVVDDGKHAILEEDIVAGGESVLSIAWALIGDGWELVTDGMGVVHLRPWRTTAITINDSILCSSLSEGTDADGNTLDYTREWSDDIDVGSYVRISGMYGIWEVMSQRISCGCGATVAETVSEVK